MPEMKRNFTKGKMNKDLDERLVPNGEYRDAMNIQVSTADDSDVGTVQNILGNTQGCTYDNNNPNPIPPGAFTVGSISDEKNDALYWLVSGHDIDIYADNFDYSQLTFTPSLSFKDVIMRRTPQGCEPVFVDKYAFSALYTPEAPYKTIIGSLSNVTPDIINMVETGWTVTSIKLDGTVIGDAVVSKVSGKETTPFNYKYHRTPYVPPVFDGGNSSAGAIVIGIMVSLLDQFDLLNFLIPFLSIDPLLAMAPPPGITSDPYIVFNPEGKLVINPNNGNIIPPSWEEGDEIHFLAEGDAPALSGFIGSINLGAENTIIIVDGNGDMIRPDPHSFSGQLLHGPLSTISFTDLTVSDTEQTNLFFKGPRTLNFNHNQYITGINIIDDMLFWTDNMTEPKKINISRSIEGTDFSGTEHTLLVNKELDYGPLNSIKLPVQEKHITVVRKSPKNSVSLELISARDPDLMYSAIMTTADGLLADESTILDSSNNTVDEQKSFATLAVGDTVRFEMENDTADNDDFKLEWEVGDILLLKEHTIDISGTQIPEQVPLNTWVIRGEIIEWGSNSFQRDDAADIPAQVAINILGVIGNPPLPEIDGTLNYVVDLEQTDKAIFELKFPRFSYRYKYQDGEYSTFAPWSEIAFLPGLFNYDPKEGWNTGMVNIVEEIKLKNFIAQDAPKDIVSVDILYKEEESPNIYIVETIAPLDDVVDNDTHN